MPQTFNIVRCFNCLVYQVDIEKKSTTKWTCKLCGSKQTLKQVYFEGESRECRDRVKQLNMMNGERERAVEEANISRVLSGPIMAENGSQVGVQHWQMGSQINRPQVSKWTKYLSKQEIQTYYGDANCENSQWDLVFEGFTYLVCCVWV